MGARRYISTDLWEDEYIQSLKPMARYLFVFLISNPRCSIAGVYEITLETMKRLTGMNKDQVKKHLDKFEADKKIVYRDSWIILANAPKHQHWERSEPVRKGIEACLRRAPGWIFAGIKEGTIPYAYPMDRVPIPPTYGIPTPGGGLASYSDLDSDIDSDSDGTPVENLLSGLADKLTAGSPKGRRT